MSRLSAAGSLNVPPRDDCWLDDDERDEERADVERLELDLVARRLRDGVTAAGSRQQIGGGEDEQTAGEE